MPGFSRKTAQTRRALSAFSCDIHCDRLGIAAGSEFAMLDRALGNAEMSESGTQPHILVVDDARDIREPLTRYLKENGYRATAAENAAAARRFLRTAGIDLVV